MTENNASKNISDTRQPNNTSPTTKSKMNTLLADKHLTSKILGKVLLILLGYIASYLQWSILLPLALALLLVWLEHLDTSKVQRIKSRAAACSYTRKDLATKINELPAWVMFPDRERAEWLNEIMAQLWPTMNNYIVKVFRGSIQTTIRKKYEGFRFEDIDLGCNPPQIDGVKVYNRSKTKDSIIVDFDVFYDGNCDIGFSMKGAQMGGIRDFQLSVEVRIVLKPLLLKAPLIGGIQIFFLNTPDLNFTLEGLSGIPGLSSFIRSKIEQKLTKLVVYPNKITKKFVKSVEAVELKALEPAGVLRVHVFEAKDLVAKDITGKSDPYVVLYVGAQECRTHHINQTLSPKWDYWCEFIVLDPMSQHLGFKLFDRDNVNEDDFMGRYFQNGEGMKQVILVDHYKFELSIIEIDLASTVYFGVQNRGDVDISTVIKGDTDRWLKLDHVKHGKIHLRFTWLGLTSDIDALNAASEEARLLKVSQISTAVLIIYVDSAQNLQPAKEFKKPHPFLSATVCNRTQKTKVKKHTVDPNWEQGLLFLVSDPKIDQLYITITDKETDTVLDQMSYRIDDLSHEPEMCVSKQVFSLSGSENAKLIMSLQLKILTNDLFINEEDSEIDSEDELSRQNSARSTASASSSNNAKSEPSPVQEEIKSVRVVPDSAAIKPLSGSLKRMNSAGEHKLGKIDITLAYSELRQKLLVTIHRISNLPLKSPTDIPDPYVKVKLLPAGASAKHKTKTIIDNCDPVFEETFEYLMSKSEVQEQKLQLKVKTVKKMFFNNNFLGEVNINLKYVSIEEPYRNWYDLCREESE